jgi:hypothetical protein
VRRLGRPVPVAIEPKPAPQTKESQRVFTAALSFPDFTRTRSETSAAAAEDMPIGSQVG